jgi:hypothetical protein
MAFREGLNCKGGGWISGVQLVWDVATMIVFIEIGREGKSILNVERWTRLMEVREVLQRSSIQV